MSLPLTRDYKETVLEDMRRNPGFRAAMLREGVDALLCGELNIGKEVLRDYVNTTMGFEALAKEIGIPSKSLMRMLGRAGNPQISNLLAIIGALQRHAGIELHVAGETKRAKLRKSRARVAQSAAAPAGFADPGRSFRRKA
ncbi:MAG TPA: transcriptional regulator [Rhizomicrobium sp.]|jgi:DNA-binding phage protein